jgi:hypothetical protein
LPCAAFWADSSEVAVRGESAVGVAPSSLVERSQTASPAAIAATARRAKAKGRLRIDLNLRGQERSVGLIPPRKRHGAVAPTRRDGSRRRASGSSLRRVPRSGRRSDRARWAVGADPDLVATTHQLYAAAISGRRRATVMALKFGGTD